MAQARFWNYKADDSTYALSTWMLGLIPPGLYYGFDWAPLASLTLRLSHGTTGITYPNKDQVLIDKRGIWRSNQGIIISEDEDIDLSIQSNLSAFPRIDIVVGTHQFTEVEGGSQAIYYVVTGTPAAIPIAPGVINALTDVILGYVYMPAGAALLTDADVLFTKSDFPHWGGKEDDFNNNNKYQYNYFVTDGMNRKQAIEALDNILKQTIVTTPIVKPDATYPTVSVVADPAPSVPSRNEYIIKTSQVNLGHKPIIQTIFPSGKYFGEGFDNSEASMPAFSDYLSLDYPWMMEVDTYLFIPTNPSIVCSNQTLRILKTPDGSHQLELTRVLSKSGAGPVTVVYPWTISKGRAAYEICDTVLLTGSMGSGGDAVGTGLAISLDTFSYINNIGNDSVTLKKDSVSTVDWSSKINSVPQVYNLPEDGVRRRISIEARILWKFDDGLSHNMSWGIGISKRTPNLNDQHLVYGMWKLYQQDSADAGSGVAEIGIYVKDSTTSYSYIDDGSAGRCVRLHFRQFDNSNVTIARVRLSVLGTPVGY